MENDLKQLEVLQQNIEKLKAENKFNKENVLNLIYEAKKDSDEKDQKIASGIISTIYTRFEKIDEKDFTYENVVNVISEAKNLNKEQIKSEAQDLVLDTAKDKVAENSKFQKILNTPEALLNRIPGDESLSVGVPLDPKLKELPKNILSQIELSSFGYLKDEKEPFGADKPLGTTLRTTQGGLNLMQGVKLDGFTPEVGLGFGRNEESQKFEAGPSLAVDDIEFSTKKRNFNLGAYLDTNLVGGKEARNTDLTIRAEWDSNKTHDTKLGKFLGEADKFVNVGIEDVGTGLKPSFQAGLQFNLGKSNDKPVIPSR